MDGLPEERRLARVVATITSDESSTIILTTSDLNRYIGKCHLKDGSMIEILKYRDKLHAHKPEIHIIHLLPQNETHFNFSGSDENKEFEFKFDKKENASELTFKVNRKLEFRAFKSDKTNLGH